MLLHKHPPSSSPGCPNKLKGRRSQKDSPHPDPCARLILPDASTESRRAEVVETSDLQKQLAGIPATAHACNGPGRPQVLSNANGRVWSISRGTPKARGGRPPRPHHQREPFISRCPVLSRSPGEFQSKVSTRLGHAAGWGSAVWPGGFPALRSSLLGQERCERKAVRHGARFGASLSRALALAKACDSSEKRSLSRS